MSDPLDRVKAALADRYTLERELGQGGMATVYLAQDLKHHRQVAVKVLRPELAATVESERFLREVDIAASLQHPNILPLHDSGEADGFLYYVMPYVEGHTLRERLIRERELPVGEVVRILRDVADALTEAHAHGVVHRDLKPENIMLSGHHALVADFGVAKAVSEATGRHQLTTKGVALGTPAYMAPEQAAADPLTDHRADVYALGVVAYEMLTGEPPFVRGTPQAVLAAQVTEAPAPVTERRETVPPALAALVMRCLAKKPADRPQRAEELLTVLEALATPSGGMTPTDMQSVTAVAAPVRSKRRKKLLVGVAAVVVIAAGAVGAWALLGRGGEIAEPTEGPRFAALDDDRRAVAVLPFTDMSAEGDQQYFGDGIAEEILNSLARIPGLRVAARTSAFKLRDEDVAAVGAQLGVGSVLEGSVRREGDRVRITAQLIQVEDGFHLWSETYDRVITDLFAVQEEIAEAIAGALQVHLGVQPAGTRERGLTDDLEAYELYLLGRDRWAIRSPETIREAIGYFERAVQRDSTFGLAYSGIADAYMVLRYYDPTVDGLQAYERAKPAALRAHELNPNLGEVHATLGNIAHSYEWDWQAGERYLREAIELAPGYEPAHQWYSNLLRDLGKYEEALHEIRVAQALDPLFNALDWSEAFLLTVLGRTDEARATYERAIAVRPVIPWVLTDYAVYLLRTEPTDPARAADLAAEAATMFGYPSPDRIRAAVLGLADGTTSEADWTSVLADLERQSVLTRPDLLQWYGRPKLADAFFDVLGEALDARHQWISITPAYVASYAPELTKDPRWQAFLTRIHYPGAAPSAGEGR